MTDASDFSTLTPEVQDVLRKFRILGPEGYTQTVIKTSTEGGNGREPLGAGPLVDPMVIGRLLDADATPNKAWLSWMLFQAAGGKEAQKRGELLMAKIRDRFIKTRKTGFNRNGVWHEPVSTQEAERQWEANKEAFTSTVVIGDQDLADKPHQVFGFYRHWPGKNRMYERVALAVSKFQKLARKAKEMNKHLMREGMEDKMVGFEPKDYPTVDALEAAIRTVERFHASKAARSDVRIETVYDDDYLTVIVPLTYAAAVRYGWDEWAWANRGQFETSLRGEGSGWNHPWKNTTGRDGGVFVYIQFKVPMPSWVAYSKDRFRRHTLHNLALVIPANRLGNFNEDTIKLYDEENRQNITLGQIKQQIRDEGAREYNPEEEEYPIHRGPRVYKDQSEAEEVVKHLDAALDAIKQWASGFDPSKIVSDFLPNT